MGNLNLTPTQKDKLLKQNIRESARINAIRCLKNGKFDDKPTNRTYLRLTNKDFYKKAYRYYWDKHFIEYLPSKKKKM